MKLQKGLREFVALLLSRGVHFVVIGGHAVAFHGYPRLTDDLDLLIRPTTENAQRVIAALAEFGFGSIGSARTISSGATKSFNPVAHPIASICSRTFMEPRSTRFGRAE
jgi:hypothetical protein